MVIFGLLLLIVGVIGVVGGLFGTGYESDKESTSYIGFDAPPEVIFLIGVISAVLIIAGLWVMKLGAKQGWKRRKEHRRLGELSEKLERAEADRRGDDPSRRDGDH